MKKFTKFVDLRKIEEQRRIKDDEKLLSIGIKSKSHQYDQPTFDIQRIEDSINSGFISIPSDATIEDMRKILLS